MQVEFISYEIDWTEFRVGYSFFIPCLKPKEAIPTIMETIDRLKFDVVTKIVVEDGIRGVRVWRI